jgi:hypothetical protein
MIFNLAIPGYDERSAGVRICWYLDTLLTLAGYQTVTDWSKPADNDIVVYPDCVVGNPLEAKRVVRYMLYFASAYFGGGMIPKTELVIPYSDYLVKEVQAHYEGMIAEPIPIPCIEPGLFFPEEKSVEAVLYTGKETVGLVHRPLQEIPVITRTSHTREQTASLLRKARNLYTLDHYTAMVAEAQLCGARVWLVDGPQSFREVVSDPTPWVMNFDRDEALGRKFAETALKFFSVDGEASPP